MMRARLGALARRLRRPRTRPRILMYHRVADLARDPWGLAVRPARFAEQLDVLRRQRTVLPLDELVARLRAGSLAENAVAVTFDDGYADNLHNARPALAAAGVPATLFLASGLVGSPRGFWWDELAHLVLAREAPAAAEIDLPDGIAELRLGVPEPGDRDPAWRGWLPPGTARQRAYLALWRRLRALAPGAQDRAMRAVRASLGDPGPCAGDRVMTADEVGEIIAGGLVRLGGHTARHPALPTLSPADQRAEVLAGLHDVERWSGARVRGFAYPYGALCGQSRAVVAECGFEWACGTDADAPLHGRGDPFALPRLAVADVDGDAFGRALAA